MKARRPRGFIIVIWCAAICITAVLLNSYVRFISEHIHDDSSQNLSEIYSQVDVNFNTFLDQNWRTLKEWHDLILDNPASAKSYIDTRREQWGFSSFLFLSEDQKCLTIDGQADTLDLGSNTTRLFKDKQNVMDGQILPDGAHITFLAVPVPESSYNGFSYSAIAFAYTNDDMAKALNTNAFDGKSTCFVLKADGQVVLSTQQGGTVFANYLSYLKAGSNLTEDEIAQLENNWASRASDVIRCRIGEENYYISYQPVGYLNYVLVGVVPESAVSESMLQIQRATVDVAIKIALVLGALLILLVVLKYRKKARENAVEIKYRDLMFSTLSDSVNDISIMIDGKDYAVDYVSPNVKRLLGISSKEIYDDIRNLLQCSLTGTPIISADELQHINPGDNASYTEELMNVATGERRWYNETIYHEQIDDHDKYFIIMSDRTEERRMHNSLEEALQSAKSANQAKSDFLSSMSHDIRTPMNAILGFTELLDMHASDSTKVKEYVKKISTSGEHLLSLINDILDMSKIESGKTSLNLEEFRIQQMLDDLNDIILPQADAKSQQFNIVCSPDLTEYVVGDKLRVYQILINLLSNAVKYTPNNGNIELAVSNVSEASGTLYEHIRFTVSDNGFGMDGAFLQTIFDPFTRDQNANTSSIQGTGLGMAITKSLVDLMGGTINVQSELGNGSTFTVDLPFERASDDADHAVEIGEERASADVLNGLKILMAEDNELSAEMLMERLEIEGAQAERARNGQEAVDMFVHSDPGYYDLILMDVEMPVMRGYDATKAIRASDHENAQGIPIFAMTANVFADDVKQALDAGMNTHLAKPIDIDKLKIAVELYLKG